MRTQLQPLLYPQTQLMVYSFAGVYQKSDLRLAAKSCKGNLNIRGNLNVDLRQKCHNFDEHRTTKHSRESVES